MISKFTRLYTSIKKNIRDNIRWLYDQNSDISLLGVVVQFQYFSSFFFRISDVESLRFETQWDNN